MKRIKSDDITLIGDVVYYRGIPFSGILLYEDETTQTKREIEILDGLKNGSERIIKGFYYARKLY